MDTDEQRLFTKVLVMGIYHSCTNAMVLELQRRFQVEVVNDWKVSKAEKDWKHRVNWETPPGLSEDCLAVLMVKEPHFWLQSCRWLSCLYPVRTGLEQLGEVDASPET